MPKRKIIKIERDLCDGCGLCLNACAEGALALDAENKVYLVKEVFCDGMGACLDVCPTGALKVAERESPDYDPRASYEHVRKLRGDEAAKQIHGYDGIKVPEVHFFHPEGGGCPGSLAREIRRENSTAEKSGNPRSVSELRQWPIQLHLVSPSAPYFEDADLLIAADCTAFASGSFHPDLLKNKRLVIACPKLDETAGYVEKLTELFQSRNIRSVTVAIMAVPCCRGLMRIAEEAVRLSGKNIPLELRVINVE